MPNTNQTIPAPIPLVQTWCLLFRHEEINEHAKEMLLNTFGDMRTVVAFVKKHKIKV